MFPDLEPEYKPVEVMKLVKKVNPWLSGNGVYDLHDPEINRVVSAFNAKTTKTDKCSLLTGWHDTKYGLLSDGYVAHENLGEAMSWFATEESSLKGYVVNR
jgi:hypothetical protein